jgi:hypothetical protein
MDGEVPAQPIIDPEWLAEVRSSAEELLAELDRMQLCQAAAYLSTALDLLDEALVEPVNVRQEM